jgi:TPR repeat protein
MYAKGEGVAKDRGEAARWFRMAAGEGNAEAQIYLGAMYLRGEGVEKDREAAAVWFRKAAAQGSVRAKQYLEHLSLKKATEPDP